MFYQAGLTQDEINAALEKLKDIWKIEKWQSEDNICIVDDPDPPNIEETGYSKKKTKNEKHFPRERISNNL